jgi:cob(I)alamin adenosyltransferase
MTGRGATRKLIALADLVTEMKPIKHPFEKGVEARKGIEF